jgi:hypothetical protein
MLLDATWIVGDFVVSGDVRSLTNELESKLTGDGNGIEC